MTLLQHVRSNAVGAVFGKFHIEFLTPGTVSAALDFEIQLGMRESNAFNGVESCPLLRGDSGSPPGAVTWFRTFMLNPAA
jgi:hypothetical protein